MASQSTSKTLLVCKPGIVGYEEAWDLQKNILQRKKNGFTYDVLLLLQHPHTYTLGKVADRNNLLLNEAERKQRGIEVFDIDRGGDITYHGPGQLVGYPIIDLKNWYCDSHKYLRALEEIIIDVLLEYGISAGRKEGLTGVWISERKIAAIGIKISSWITMHGFAFNINPDLSLFDGIIPCGIKDKEVTSLYKETGLEHSIEDACQKLIAGFIRQFTYSANQSITLQELKAL